MPSNTPPTGTKPARQRTRAGNTSSRASKRTDAIRGSTGLTKVQEDTASALLRTLAEQRHGLELGDLTDADRQKLTRDVADLMRRRSRKASTRRRITVAGVRKIAQRVRSGSETRRTFPVDLGSEAYAVLAQQCDKNGKTMKATAAIAIMAMYGGE